jgi:hypothetical protein
MPRASFRAGGMYWNFSGLGWWMESTPEKQAIKN